MFFRDLANIFQNSETPSLWDGPFLMGNTVHSANSWKVSGRKSHNTAYLPALTVILSAAKNLGTQRI